MKTIEFEKKGLEFTVTVNDDGEAIIETKGIMAEVRGFYNSKAGWGYEVYDSKFAKAIGAPKADLFIVHPSGEEARQAVREAKATAKVVEKAKAEARRQDILDGKVTIKVAWYDGEYLGGWMVTGEAEEVAREAASLLVGLGIAHEVEGWGIIVDNDAIEALGKEFTYKQAAEYARPKQEALAAKEAEKEAERQAKFAKAAATGQPVEIERYIVDCDGSVDECSTDIIIVYAMPDGSTQTTRTHTY